MTKTRASILIAVLVLVLVTALGSTREAAAGNKHLLLFSDESPKVFLGCLTCSEFDTNSVWNTIGRYGSSISSTSVRNSISKYGSTISPTSACNTIAQRPPLIVDEEGGYYGRLTVNTIHRERSSSSSLKQIAPALCQH